VTKYRVIRSKNKQRLIDPDHVKHLSTMERRRVAYAMHLEGYSYEAIAERLGYQGSSGAFQAVNKVKLLLRITR
jgi:hypothetical protein